MGFENAINTIVNSSKNNSYCPNPEYVGKDGLLYCSICHKPTQCNVKFLEHEQIVPCLCDCTEKERQARKEKERQLKIAERRKNCFAGTNMANWTFENDDRKNAKISNSMLKYTDNFADFKKKGEGLLIYGTVGTGKTYFAACVANRLIDRGYKVLMTNFAKLINQLQSTFDGKQDLLDKLNGYDLLVIDDLGAESDSKFRKETIHNIIDSRYSSGLPLIVTTNLTSEELKKPQDIDYVRVYDRILERCHPVEVSGISRRRTKLKENFQVMQSALGLDE